MIKKSPLTKKILIILTALVFVGLVATSYYFYNRYHKVTKNSQALAEEEVKGYVAKINHYLDLPTDETPTLATVIDKDKLKDQPFFFKAINGDKALIYTKNKQVILYRPSVNRVINIAPLTINNPVTTTTPSAATNVRVAIYNGSKTAGLAATVQKKIATIDGIKVTATANAAKNDYTETEIIDLNGAYSGLATDIAQLVSGKVKTLPEGESKPDADILIIAAK